MFIKITKKQFNKKNVWHPYTSMIKPLKCYSIKKAKGVVLKLFNNINLIDGMSSWWSCIHGYNNSILNKAIKTQIKKMSHIMFGGFYHKEALKLCNNLINITPKELKCVFLADSGSVAIEIAIKMSLQYWQSKGEYREKILTIKNGYHGDTFGAMSVCDPKNSMHNIYKKYLTKHIFAESPKCKFNENWDENDINSFKYLIKKYSKKIACVILEPIVQGAGGMKIYNPMYLKRVSELCKKYEILLILDEIATGFGRTGKLFAYEHSGIVPDILCLGKSLTGGYMTLSATITTKKISYIISNSKSGCFMHGPTFMGNPLACSIANANLEILNTNKWIKKVKYIENYFKKTLLPLIKSNKILDIRILGAISIIETINYIDINKIQRFFINNGVWIRPFGKLIYLMPPYIIKKTELNILINSLISLFK
ncbi:adenosylmethionine--8-amino-7-oxononanoate transaminase [Enterobacteriaceae bacterium ET-AT1-13]|nr:adenosylmethionine--8-amino-7-oxononanoate transaminase [Enterobacteriaceae bacterium ET-AT1-13]WGS66470.1 adenosylmethionine--8-amino-7-oxononanoate transaminase [Enterobacteriaceae bacterium Cmel17]WMC17495.1 MAG: adenosylmethionine--8-amino-7-oxononanoate transaminase [Enterobacteriaceae bacterium Cmel21]WMC17702.1 MAG: adenosylmethionine--8-amino-7-oxononanoate transaminase [Enterobacteriaceae bacterium PSmelAO3-2]WMC17906.1 MAG: adenosylmethionine--8-amino-7-oxononanoate transaminase [E